MIRGTTTNAPFSRYKQLMRRTPVSKPTTQTQTYSGQYNNSYSNPELDGMKHTMDRGSNERDFGIERMKAKARQKQLHQQQTAAQVAAQAKQTTTVPAEAEAIYPETVGATELVPQIQETQPVEATPDTTIGAGYTEATAPEWGTEEYQQGMYNLAREQMSGQTAADLEYARTELGGRGFRAGESGIANRALMNIRRKGAETLGQESRKMAMQGMGARYGQQQDLMNMIMQKYGIDVAGQQRRFDPYYDVEQQYAGIA